MYNYHHGSNKTCVSTHKYLIIFSKEHASSYIAGGGSGSVWISYVQCYGAENSLLDCPHYGWQENSCTHDRDAGVICVKNGNFDNL